MITKAQILSHHRCPRKLWLDEHQPDLSTASGAPGGSTSTKEKLKEVARCVYGTLLSSSSEETGNDTASADEENSFAADVGFSQSFCAGGVAVRSDIVIHESDAAIQIIGLKATGQVKPQHIEEMAIQWHAAAASGLVVRSAAVTHVDKNWALEQKGDYVGLLHRADVTEAVARLLSEVPDWIRDADLALRAAQMPAAQRGSHCNAPYECGFQAYCHSLERQPRHPADVLPSAGSQLRAMLRDENGIKELEEIPDDLLSPLQLRVKEATLTNTPYVNLEGASLALSKHSLPAYFLDFETVMATIPRWPGTRPFQQIPFQHSLHVLNLDGSLTHHEFLDLSGEDPSRAIAEDLIDICGTTGPIFAYNASFESRCLKALADRFDYLKDDLLRLEARLIDLLPITRSHFYHPNQKGSWSIKAVLPAIAPDLDYVALEGVQNGALAVEAYAEAIAAGTSAERREQLRRQLLAYCQLDTLAMVRIWSFFIGKDIAYITES